MKQLEDQELKVEDLVAFAGGNYVIFLLSLVVNAFFLCRTDLQIHVKSFKKLSQTGAGVPLKTLSAPKLHKATQERPKRPPETAKKRLESLPGALLRRFGRALGRLGEPNGSKMEPKLNQKLSKVVLGRVSHAHFVFQLMFLTF